MIAPGRERWKQGNKPKDWQFCPPAARPPPDSDGCCVYQVGKQVGRLGIGSDSFTLPRTPHSPMRDLLTMQSSLTPSAAYYTEHL